MNIKWKIAVLIVLLIITLSFVGGMPGDRVLVTNYDKNVFYPYQSLRGILLGHIPFSLGDILYVLAGAGILIGIIRWLRNLFRFGQYTDEMASGLLTLANTLLAVYLLFIISWGANYYKRPLSEMWDFSHPHYKLQIKSDSSSIDAEWIADTSGSGYNRAMDSAALIAFHKFLLDKLNTFAAFYQPLSFSEVNERAKFYYDKHTDSKVKTHGLNIKPSLFGFLMERMAVEGYYNPFTGEGQVNSELPAFIMPFLVAHEMAHQAGIAAEGDANLLSYTLCTTARDSTFNYSAYLSLWLYTHNRLYRRDSLLANKLETKLNKFTRAQLDTLDEIDRKYSSKISHYSSDLYDGYLKMNNQKEGIRSYGDVITSAWEVEVRRKKGTEGLIVVP